MKKAKPLEETVLIPVEQLDGNSIEYEFDVLYNYIPESDGFSADVNILKIDWSDKKNITPIQGNVIEFTKMVREGVETELLDLHLNHR